MPNTPRVNFNIINNNVEESYPSKGISLVLARTTKGPKNDPSSIISSIPQFHREFGNEIVPDGSVSNIEKALQGRSKLRIIRVMGSDASQGKVQVLTPASGEEDPTYTYAPVFWITPLNVTGGILEYEVFLKTRGYGETIDNLKNYAVSVSTSDGSVILKIHPLSSEDKPLEEVIYSSTIFTYKKPTTGSKAIIDYNALLLWSQNNPYFEVEVKTYDTTTERNTPVNNILDLVNRLAELDGSDYDFDVDTWSTPEVPTDPKYGSIWESGSYMYGSIGSSGSDPVKNDWIAACEFIKDYVDVYNILASNLHLHLSNTLDMTAVYKELANMCNTLEEFRLFIEIPVIYTDNSGKHIRPLEGENSIISWKNALNAAIGYSKWVSYYTAGLWFINNNGILQESSVGGTTLGLADSSATSAGYDKSFAGMNRGIVLNSKGPVIPNYGSPGRVEDLEKLAQANINVYVIKDTPTYGKTTLLWHNFTDGFKKDSFRFLGNTGLVLDIKKTLRPILETYIEEPNIWGTWKNIYLRVLPLINAWVDANAITDPKWQGDQDANSWADLKINTEAECRQGHYKVQFTFKDVVALQDITIDLVIESSSKSVDISVED